MSELTPGVCITESYLVAKSDRSVAFKHDLHYMRVAIALGKIGPVSAFNHLEEGEIRPFSPNIAVEVQACFNNIAAGNCPQYPKM